MSTEQQADTSKDPKLMTLWGHLDELRSRIVKSLWAVTIFFFVAISFATDLINFLQRPLLAALPPDQRTLHFTGPMDVFVANIKVSLLTALVIGSPFWIYQFWKFIEPALYDHERKWILPFVVTSIILFLSGVSFCFFVMMPVALSYLIGLGMEVGVPIITITDYLSLLIILLFAFGLVFETPLILVLLSLLDLVSAKSLSEHRKIIVVAILVIAAVLTPPDVISQSMMAVPMYIMYEAAVVIIRLIERGKKPKKEIVHAP